MEKALYDTYLAILKEELVPAMGCTEPIAVAYAAALAARALGCPAEQAEVAASANIIKNVKSVVVPHTGGRRGIAAAAAAGIVAGDADKELEVLCAVTEDDLKKMADFLEKTPIHVERSGKPYLFDIQVRLFGGGHTAFAEIAGHHTNVIALQRDGEVLLQKEYVEQTSTQATDHTLLNVEQIVQFADEADLNDVKETLQRQIVLPVLCRCAVGAGRLHRKGGGTGPYISGVPVSKTSAHGTRRTQGPAWQTESKIPRLACGTQSEKGGGKGSKTRKAEKRNASPQKGKTYPQHHLYDAAGSRAADPGDLRGAAVYQNPHLPWCPGRRPRAGGPHLRQAERLALHLTGCSGSLSLPGF